MVDDSREFGPECDEILVESITFSPDGKHLAYGIRRDGKWSIVSDGVVGPSADAIGKASGVHFSSDGKHLAYAMRDGALQKLAYCDAQSLKICPTGPAPKFFAVLDAQTGAKFDDVGIFRFSPVDQALTYAAKTGELWHLMPGGNADLQFDDILALNFAADGTLRTRGC